MNTELIYLAAPYNHKDIQVVHERMSKVYKVLAFLTYNNHIVVTPLLMHEVVVRHELPNSFESWSRYSFLLLSKCQRMVVLKLDGWDESQGVLAEIKFATQTGIPVVYKTEEDFM